MMVTCREYTDGNDEKNDAANEYESDWEHFLPLLLYQVLLIIFLRFDSTCHVQMLVYKPETQMASRI